MNVNDRRILAALIDLLVVAVPAGALLSVAGVTPPLVVPLACAWGLYYWFAFEAGGRQTLGGRLVKPSAVVATGATPAAVPALAATPIALPEVAPVVEEEEPVAEEEPLPAAPEPVLDFTTPSLKELAEDVAALSPLPAAEPLPAVEPLPRVEPVIEVEPVVEPEQEVTVKPIETLSAIDLVMADEEEHLPPA